jgi:hypothetical protein
MMHENQIDKAEDLFKRGHVDEAGEIFKLLVQLDPDNVRILNDYGVVLFRQGHLDTAEDCFLQAIARKRDHSDAVANLAELYRVSGRRDEADRILREDEASRETTTQPEHGAPAESDLSDRSPTASYGSGSEPADSESEIEAKPTASIPQERKKLVSNLDEHDDQRTSIPARFHVEEPAEPDGDPTAVDKVTHARSGGNQYGPAMPEEPDSVEVREKKLAEHLAILSDKKILHAPFEIAGNMARICRFLRQYGLKAVDVNYHDTWLKYQCSVNLSVNEHPQERQFGVIDEFAKKAMDEYDVFHFHFGRSLYPDFRDLEILKSKGKKILFSFWGSEQRGPEWILYHQARFLGYKPPKPYFLTLDHYRLHKLINRYADVMFGLTCIPRGLFLGGLIDIAEWDLSEKTRTARQFPMKKDPGKTYFLHSATSHWKKGSFMINRLVEECKADGMPIEILSVSGLPPEEAKRIYAHADYAVTQIGGGGFGLFGLEMMSWGIPILVYQSELADRLRGYPPVLRITKETFKSQVEAAIRMKENGDKEELAREGRKWVAEQADMSRWIEQYIEIYANLCRSMPVKQFINLRWYEQEHLLHSGFKSDFYRYMIDNQVFQELGIDVPQYNKTLYN